MRRILSIVSSCIIGVFGSMPLHATVFRHITAETISPTDAVINSDGSLTESGVNYACIYKPTPQASWVRTPWISPTQA